MVRAGAGQAFDSANINLGSVLDLLPQEDGSKKKQDSEPSDAESEKEEEGADGKDEKKKRGWFDKDRAVNAAQKALGVQEDKIRKLHAERKLELTDLLGKIAALPEAEQVHYRGEEKIGKVRLQFLEAIGDGSSNNLIEQFQQGPLVSPTKNRTPEDPSSSSTAAGLNQLGQSPPRKQFASLVTLSALSLLKDEVLNAETADEIKHQKKRSSMTQRPPLWTSSAHARLE